MDADEVDCDSDVLVIDYDEEPEEVGKEIPPSTDVQTNKNVTNKDNNIEQKRFLKVQHVCSNVRSCKNVNQNLDDHVIEIVDEPHEHCRVHRQCVEYRDANKIGRCNVKQSNTHSINHRDFGIRDPRTSYRIVYDKNRANMDDDMLEMAAHGQAARRTEKSQARERTVREPDVYESRYAMDDHTRSTLVNTNAYRPWITNDNMQEVAPNIPYKFQAKPEMYGSRIAYRSELRLDDHSHTMNGYAYSHAHRLEDPISRYSTMTRYAYNSPEEVLNIDDYDYRQAEMYKNTHRHYHRLEDATGIDDYRYATMNRYAYSHGLRTDVLDNYRYGTINRNAYSPTHMPERSVIIDDCRHDVMNRRALGRAYRIEDVLSKDDYRYTAMNKNIYSPGHRPENTSYINDYNDIIMSRYASEDTYNPQAGVDSYRSQLKDLHRPDVISEDTSRVNSNINYTEARVMYSLQAAHSNAYRSDLREDNYKGREEETALDLVRKREGPSNTGQNKSEPVLSTEKHRFQAPSTIDRNKPNYEMPSTIVNTMYKHKNIHTAEKTDIGYNSVVLDVHKNPEAAVQINVCGPGIPVRTNRPDTLILSTKAVYTAKASNMATQTDVPVTINKLNNFDHNNCRSDQNGEVKETVLRTNAQSCTEVLHKDTNLEDKATAADEICNRNDVIAWEINELAQDNNVQFLVVFFTQVKDLVKETFPEFAKSIQKEIETLGEKSADGEMKIDIQYICPLYCSVSTYSLPRYDNVTVDNKIEKHVNRVKICDMCSCIQHCYQLYKKKYFDLLLKYLLGNKVNENENRTKSVITSVGVDRDVAQNIMQIDDNDDDADENQRKKNKSTKSQAGSQYGKSRRAIPSNNKDTIEADYDIFIENPLRENVEKIIFDELSTLTFHLPGNNIRKAAVSAVSYGSRETIRNGNLNIDVNMNQLTPKTLAQNNLNIEVNVKDIDNKKRIYNDDYAKIESNLTSPSSNEISNVDIIASKLKNKSIRKPDAVFTCHICSCMFTYFTSFVSHMQREHDINGIYEEIPDGCIERKCPFCGFYSKQKCHNEHVKRCHPDIFTHRGELKDGKAKIKMQKIDKRKKSSKRKFIFICLVCNENLMSYEVNAHRERKHKGVNIPKMFTKRLSSPG